ncbi:6-hydroxymethylpterin diphosphokinase MptE-like protein [Spirochaeta cellobiosiphila]|uniref:6-hydroxymethylpterin diphosphokinase MptE-like protein n=1 Tax=Spirochaeta cellobiosiphila TaxID=504483 RepID=UPI00048FC9CA|nr:6-hydroxymethylpterin diphosphokinase MptE-like protein [Spirochaeta cellobiosiphila]
MITISTSKRGYLTANVNNIHIHSPYDPVREAERYLRNQVSKAPRTVIIIGECLGYLGQSIAKIYPNTIIHPMWLETTLEQNALPFSYETGWDPSKPMSWQEFISDILSKGVVGIQILIWPAMEKLFPQEISKIYQYILTEIKQINSIKSTVQHFAFQWFKNCLQNSNFIEGYYCPVQKEKIPYFIGASGTSLSEHKDWLLNNHKYIRIIALPSSLCFFRQLNIPVDFIITQDSGFWADYHLEYLPYFSHIVCSLKASRRIKHLTKKPLLFSNHSWYEKIIFDDKPVLSLPELGSVIFSAIEFAKTMTDDAIILGGADFYQKDIQTHIRPHSFDQYFDQLGSRFLGELTQKYKRMIDFNAKTIKDNYRSIFSLDYYRDWFAQQYKDTNLNQLTPHKLRYYDLPVYKSINKKEKQSLPLELIQWEQADKERSQNIIGSIKKTARTKQSKYLTEFFPLDYEQLSGYSETERQFHLNKLTNTWLSKVDKILPLRSPNV